MTQPATGRSGAARAGIFIVLAAAIFGAGWYLANRTSILDRSFAAEALVTGAMAVLVPLLYFALVALPRRQGVIPLLVGFLLCTLLAGTVLPEARESALGFVERALIVTEGLLVILIALRIRGIIRNLKEERTSGEHYGFTRQFKAAVARAMGSETVGEVMASEATNLYYGLLFFLVRSEVPAGGRPFTSYRQGYKTLFIAISVIGMLELFGMHYLLDYRFGPTTAWVVTALSIYGFLFLVADYVAMVKRPSMVYQGKFYFQMGLRWSAIIPLSRIGRAEKLAFNLDTTGMMNCAVQTQMANAVIYFTEPQTVSGPFGIRKQGPALIMNVDDLPGLIQALSPEQGSADLGGSAVHPLPTRTERLG